MRYAILLGMSMLTANFSQAYAGEAREFYIKTVHIDGQTSTKGDANHKPEPLCCPSSRIPRQAAG